jgi:hypothetical protein
VRVGAVEVVIPVQQLLVGGIETECRYFSISEAELKASCVPYYQQA